MPEAITTTTTSKRVAYDKATATVKFDDKVFPVVESIDDGVQIVPTISKKFVLVIRSNGSVVAQIVDAIDAEEKVLRSVDKAVTDKNERESIAREVIIAGALRQKNRDTVKRLQAENKVLTTHIKACKVDAGKRDADVTAKLLSITERAQAVLRAHTTTSGKTSNRLEFHFEQ